jgi:thiol-disulfide isomerase/thioredoxin
MFRCLIAVLIVAGSLSGCRTVSDEAAPTVDTGRIQREQLTDGFLHSYPQEPIEAPFLDMIRQARGGVQVIVFLGTWCSDSKHHVPRFLQIADETGMQPADYTLYALDRKKKSPEGFEQSYGIERVPTFIFFREKKEIGRIVESPRTTLEGDILRILAGTGS